MALLDWKQSLTKLKVQDTRQLYFGIYPYRLVLNIPGAGMMRYEESFDAQNAARKNVNYGGSWRRAKPLDLTSDVRFLLDHFRTVRKDPPSGVRFRIEEPAFQIYTETEAQLHAVLDQLQCVDLNNYATIYNRPATDNALELMKQGFTLKQAEYAFKMYIRDGRYNDEIKSSILSLLKAQGDKVRMPRNTEETLGKMQHSFVWGCYFYCQDESLQLLLSMISPTCIRSIERFYAKESDK